MRILLIHQNFPGQYKHLGPALAARGDQVVALTPKVTKPARWKGVDVLPYKISRGNGKAGHPWLLDLETKVIRGEACYDAAIELRDRGFNPDVILAHHGWGESMFLKDVWPHARIGLYCELYHRASYPHTGFDPEFDQTARDKDTLRLRLRNLNNALHFDIAEVGLSPTHFQADTFPDIFRDKITVLHYGIDTDLVCPNENAVLKINDSLSMSRQDEVITFINRNLEPYRGYHIFMRALPRLLRVRPKAQVVLMGGDDVSYGARPPEGKTWKQIFIDEVRDPIPDMDCARVHFLGRVPYDVFLSTIQVCRVHVYLTYPFVLSWSLLESMSAGAAIVAGDTAPVREVIEDGKTGLLTVFFDKDTLVDRVVRLLDDPSLREQLGQAARAHVISQYDLKTICLPKHLSWVNDLAAMPLNKTQNGMR
jgi:glycosyltransferase involved in cell wall biosynthesis